MKLDLRSVLLGMVIAGLLGAIAYVLRPTPPAPMVHAAPAVPEPAPAPTPAPAATPAPAVDLVLDLFEPTPDQLHAQHSAHTVHNQVEHALVVSFLLTRCGLISEQEYSDTYNALIRYLVARDIAPDITTAARETRRLAQSAGASYALVYSRVPCTDPSLPPLVSSLTQWRDQSTRTVSDSSSTP